MIPAMELVWNDGGRAAAGFVGTAGDCVVRAIAIATNEDYRAVYDALGEAALVTPRNGVSAVVFSPYLAKRGWRSQAIAASQRPTSLPHGVVLVRFEHEEPRRRGHVCCVIDQVVHDTWNPFDDVEFRPVEFWTPDPDSSDATQGRARVLPTNTDEGSRTREEYERILKRVRALNATATNEASTEGEIRNALNAMQALMTKHNLSRRDLVEQDESQVMGMTKQACVLNGTRVCQWEMSLAQYLTQEIFPAVAFFRCRRGHRTVYWFYGPWADVQQAVEVYREMLLTIATAARLKYGGHSRGSGASYAEGYVSGLPRAGRGADAATQDAPEGSTAAGEAAANHALVQNRMLAVRAQSREWLDKECGIRLSTYRVAGRGNFDAGAHQAGTRDGSRHERPQRGIQKRITYRPGS